MEVFFLPKLVSAFLSEAGPRRLGRERETDRERERGRELMEGTELPQFINSQPK
jgi:hypothetical protein